MATATGTRPLPRFGTRSFRLPLLDSYLLREMLGPFFFASGAFFVFWALNILVVAADYIVNGHAPFFLGLRFIIFRMPQAIPMAFPFGTLFASLLAMSRLMADNEITAIRTSGVPLWRLVLTPILFGFAAFGLTYAMNEYVAPPSVDLSTRTFYQIIYHTDTLPVEPQFFRKDADTGNVFYVTNVAPDNKTMTGVQLFEPGRSGYWSRTIQAKTATVNGSNLVLQAAIITNYNADGDETTQEVSTKPILIGLPLGETAAQFTQLANSDSWTMSSKALKTQVQLEKMQGIGGSTLGSLEINLANKVAWPFACVIGVFIAVPLSILFGKRGRTLSAALAILMLGVYFVFMSVATAFGRNGAFNPYVAAWVPNVILGGAGLYMLWLEEH
ncbi:MAG TPA: LptF/LptG family permease [Verrucomicrobiae bacterium]|nr:LptF/LptG family permease [Verrucomicrobiae bacterium]